MTLDLYGQVPRPARRRRGPPRRHRPSGRGHFCGLFADYLRT